MKRFADTTVVILAVTAVALGVAIAIEREAGTQVGDLWSTATRFLRTAVVPFGAALVFLTAVAVALVAETAGLIGRLPNWAAIANALYYCENAGPFYGLLETSVSFSRALLTRAHVTDDAATKAALNGEIAVALGATAGGIAIALFAYSLKFVILSRLRRAEAT